MFQQFENEISTILTTGVRNVAGAAEEIMNTAATIKSQEEKINALTKSKTSLQKKVAVLECKLQKSRQKVKLYKTQLDSINKPKKLDESYNVEVMEDTKENLLVLSHTSQDMTGLEASPNNSVISAEETSGLEESIDSEKNILTSDTEGNRSVSTEDNTEYDELNIIEKEKEEYCVSELDLMWDKMTYSIEHSDRKSVV